MDIVCRTRSSMAELPALNRVAAGSSPAGCIARTAWKDKGESEDDMERLISLFREPEPDGGYVSPNSALRPPPSVQADLKVLSDEPIYFQQLLEYLRREKQKRSDHEDDVDGGSD